MNYWVAFLLVWTGLSVPAGILVGRMIAFGDESDVLAVAVPSATQPYRPIGLPASRQPARATRIPSRRAPPLRLRKRSAGVKTAERRDRSRAPAAS